MEVVNQKELVDLWGKRARFSEAAHYDIAAAYIRRNLWLAHSVVVLSAVTGSGFFASVSTTAPKPTRFIFGAFGLLAAVLAALNRSLRYGERAEENRQAGARWARIVNSTETLHATLASGDSPADIHAQITKLGAAMTGITQHSPSIPQRFFALNGLGQTYLWEYAPTPSWTSRWRRWLGKSTAPPTSPAKDLSPPPHEPDADPG
jgi:hypothetical protein